MLSRRYILLLNIFSPRVTRVTLVPCPNTTQLVTRSEVDAARAMRREAFSLREVASDAKMATAFTPARSRHASREVDAPTYQPPSRVASPQLNATVRFPPDAYHFYSSSDASDSIFLTAAARRIAAVGAPLSAPTPKLPSSAALRQSKNSSPAERSAYRQAHRSRRPSPSPTRTHSSRFSASAGPPLKKSSPTSSPTSPIR